MRDSCRTSLSLIVLVLASSAALSSQAAPDQRAATDPNMFRAVAQEHNPSVVAIKTVAWVDPTSAEDDDWYARFFGRTL
jgi:hypothetical protein